MNTTDSVAETAKDGPTTSALPKPSKPQRRMARPAPNDPKTASPPAVTSSSGQGAATSAVGSKSAAVVALLERDSGATLAELIAATGWLPHTTRAALTGLRKKGHSIECSKREDATCYRIVKPA